MVRCCVWHAAIAAQHRTGRGPERAGPRRPRLQAGGSAGSGPPLVRTPGSDGWSWCGCTQLRNELDAPKSEGSLSPPPGGRGCWCEATPKRAGRSVRLGRRLRQQEDPSVCPKTRTETRTAGRHTGSPSPVRAAPARQAPSTRRVAAWCGLGRGGRPLVTGSLLPCCRGADSEGWGADSDRPGEGPTRSSYARPSRSDSQRCQCLRVVSEACP
jgi:hypothetical protein